MAHHLLLHLGACPQLVHDVTFITYHPPQTQGKHAKPLIHNDFFVLKNAAI
jgi:hypothetical protein